MGNCSLSAHPADTERHYNSSVFLFFFFADEPSAQVSDGQGYPGRYVRNGTTFIPMRVASSALMPKKCQINAGFCSSRSTEHEHECPSPWMFIRVFLWLSQLTSCFHHLAINTVSFTITECHFSAVIIHLILCFLLISPFEWSEMGCD